MSRVKLMLDAVDCVVAVAESLLELADNLKALVEAVGTDEPREAAKPTPQGKNETVPKADPQPEPTPTEDKPPALEEVRAALAEKSRAGKTEQVKALLLKHGAGRLSEIDPKEYRALLAEAEAL